MSYQQQYGEVTVQADWDGTQGEQDVQRLFTSSNLRELTPAPIADPLISGSGSWNKLTVNTSQVHEEDASGPIGVAGAGSCVTATQSANLSEKVVEDESTRIYDDGDRMSGDIRATRAVSESGGDNTLLETTTLSVEDSKEEYVGDPRKIGVSSPPSLISTCSDIKVEAGVSSVNVISVGKGNNNGESGPACVGDVDPVANRGASGPGLVGDVDSVDNSGVSGSDVVPVGNSGVSGPALVGDVEPVDNSWVSGPDVDPVGNSGVSGPALVGNVDPVEDRGASGPGLVGDVDPVDNSGVSGPDVDPVGNSGVSGPALVGDVDPVGNRGASGPGLVGDVVPMAEQSQEGPLSSNFVSDLSVLSTQPVDAGTELTAVDSQKNAALPEKPAPTTTRFIKGRTYRRHDNRDEDEEVEVKKKDKSFQSSKSDRILRSQTKSGDQRDRQRRRPQRRRGDQPPPPPRREYRTPRSVEEYPSGKIVIDYNHASAKETLRSTASDGKTPRGYSEVENLEDSFSDGEIDSSGRSSSSSSSSSSSDDECLFRVRSARQKRISKVKEDKNSEEAKSKKEAAQTDDKQLDMLEKMPDPVKKEKSTD